MTTRPRIILVAGLLALALMSSCQSAQKSEKENQKGKSTAAPASRTTAETKVVLTPSSVESKPSTKPSKKASTQKKTGGATTMPVSSPSSPYTEDRLHDLEKGLRRLQSLPSMTQPAKTGTRSRKQRL